MGPRPLLIVCALGSTAHAEKLVAKWLDSENIHINDPNGQRAGAINRYYGATVTLDLSANGKAKAVDAGTDRDHHLDHGSTSETKIVWTNKWAGSWKKTGTTLAITLTLDARTCTKTKTYDRYKPSTEPCGAVTKDLARTCAKTSVDVEKSTGPGVTPTSAWRCDADGEPDLAQTRRSWVFGIARCIEVGEGRHGISYRKCSTP
jgi:hypothetical protein